MFASKQNMHSVSINWIRFLYFIIYASFGTTAIYRTLYFRRVGLGEAQIGILIAIEPLVMIVAGPLWSLLADRLGIRSRLLSVLTACTILPMLGMIWLNTFPQLVALNILYALFWSPIQPLMDCTALAILGDDREKYATIRAFGSLGYAPVSWITGMLIQGRDIRWVFAGFALLMSLGSLASLRVPSQSSGLQSRLAAGVRSLLTNRDWIIFMLAFSVAMAAQAVTFGYGSLYLDTLGAKESVIGLSGAVGSIGQTLLMLGVLSWLLRTWGSERLLLFSLLLYCVRFAIWIFVPNPRLVAMSQVLLGLSYGSALIASVDYAARSAPVGLEATSQAIVTGLVNGLARSVGSVAGGSLYQGVGPQRTFIISGMVVLLAAVTFALIRCRQELRIEGTDPSTVAKLGKGSS